MDYTEVQKKIVNLAKQKYALCRDKGEDGTGIVHQLTELQGNPLTSELLRAITAQITVKHTQVTALVLKNGKTIEKGGTPHE